LIPTLAAATAPAERPAGPLHLGFLTVLREAGGYLGGYLVTNVWGRPIEFRLSSAVQPNRVQQILYAATLEPYVCGDLIGKTLVEKTNTPVDLLVTDREPVLDVRLRVAVPVLLHKPAEAVRTTDGCPYAWCCHPRYPQDLAAARGLLERLDASFDLAEPFARIREAIGEARKLGVANTRAAA